jgi:hypothetical protein
MGQPTRELGVRGQNGQLEREGLGALQMAEQRDFWLQLHQLAVAYKALAATPDERMAALIAQFKGKSPAAQSEAAEQMLMLAAALGNLYGRTVA